MDDDQQFCLRWNNHQSTLISVFDTLLENETLVDCTLAAEGKFLKAHKVVLSACSPYFATLLQEQYDKHPIFILKDVKYQELRAMMDYMYRGEVNISQDQLAALLKAAESLQIKGLSDNRSGGGSSSAPKPEQQQQQHHRGLNVPGLGVGKLGSGYTLEQTQKRARIGPSSMDSQEMSGSREGSSSPSRRRRKVRRRSIENAMADVHDNSNSSQMQVQQSSLLQQQQQQSNASLAGVGAITAAASALASQGIPVSAATLPTGSTGGAAATLAAAAVAAAQGTTQQLTTSVTKKTESVKGTSDAMNTENLQASGSASVGGGAGGADDQQEMLEHHHGATKTEKQNHKQKSTAAAVGKDTVAASSELVIEPKSEYEEEGNDETVEDLTLDDEDMGMEDLDQNAGTSQGAEGSSQGYAPWQHDRSQDELLLATQEAQQRDPQDATHCPVNKNNNNHSNQDACSQSESRIRVRNWLMLADQSILEKSIQDEKLTTTNKNTDSVTVTSPASNDTTNKPNSNNNNKNVADNSIVLNSVIAATPLKQPLPVIDPNKQTMTRIGSIGRTTIACITPAGAMVGSKNPLNNGSVGMVSAAALAAAGVELDTIDDSMTEVIVKIENTESSINDEDEELEEPDDPEEEPPTEEGAEGEPDFNYDLKLSSPMSWAFDTVKIEHEEEFEDITSGEQDTTNNTEDDDDLLTTAAATTKQAAAATLDINEQPILTRSGGAMRARTTTKKRTGLSGGGQQQLQQTQQQLLEQQQHLQHLQLQPNQAVAGMRMRLPTIPATITSIAPKQAASATAEQQPGGNSSSQAKNNSEFQSSLSDDKRYRILIQNQRMRKESLEHSDDMIYNADIEKPWVCRNCNRNYKWKNSLKCHLKNECGQPPRYFCSKLCGYATNVHSNLKRHLNTKCRDRMDEEPQAQQVQVQVQQQQQQQPQKAGHNSGSSNTTSYTLVLQKHE